MESYSYSSPQACIDAIKSGGGGNDIRYPIVEAMRMVNDNGRNASTFANHPAKDWMLVTELDTIYTAILVKIKKDEVITKGSENLVMVKGLRKFFGNINNYPDHN